VCKVEEIHTTLRKHLAKEEAQLLPLLLAHFSHAEQAELVAQFLYCIPLATVEAVLTWLKQGVPPTELAGLMQQLRDVIRDSLLQQLLVTWLQPNSAAAAGAGAGAPGAATPEAQAAGQPATAAAAAAAASADADASGGSAGAAAGGCIAGVSAAAAAAAPDPAAWPPLRVSITRTPYLTALCCASVPWAAPVSHNCLPVLPACIGAPQFVLRFGVCACFTSIVLLTQPPHSFVSSLACCLSVKCTHSLTLPCAPCLPRALVWPAGGGAVPQRHPWRAGGLCC
jgi:hypothetical protein